MNTKYKNIIAPGSWFKKLEYFAISDYQCSNSRTNFLLLQTNQNLNSQQNPDLQTFMSRACKLNK